MLGTVGQHETLTLPAPPFCLTILGQGWHGGHCQAARQGWTVSRRRLVHLVRTRASPLPGH